ncbi:GDSL esterase/lipase [Sesamum angolense]|uniref:GDSL esterase/lipase n=1 Tax=Sesamum angolense TaxID=2727404 RepID=A0AAE1T4F8_9LAMI|nr:GDSL esterase/lipase [Sesamum angolense]
MADNKSSFCGLCLILLVLSANNTSLGRGQEDAFAPEGSQRRRELVPAMFIFGDSLIDNGNNNNLPSFAKANYLPYGIDFNGGPTGRFSNGYTMVDTIGTRIAWTTTNSAYSEASGDQMRYGVNYASAAAGILDITGRNFVSRIPFNQQIKNFEDTLDQITDSLGAPDVAQALAKCIFFVGMGSNDYLNNYLMPNYDTKYQYNAQQYADLLVQQYSQQLTEICDSRAGTNGLHSKHPCSEQHGICSEEVNQLVLPFNTNTKAMINNLSANLPGARFSYIDIRNMFRDLLANAGSYGFSVLNRGCCGIGRNRGQITCLPFQTPCPERNQYIFWDAFHPTEAVNVLFGQKAFHGNTEVVYPINIEQLANL